MSKVEIKTITPKELIILARRQAMYNFKLDIISLQKEEILESSDAVNTYASNAAPSEEHLKNETKNKKDIVIKDVDTGIGNGKFRIMITTE